MKKYTAASLFAMCLTATNAVAQNSTCMSMGNGMVNCNHSGGGSTNCMSMGNNMATCHTTGVPDNQQVETQQDDGARALGEGLGSLIVGIRERSFRAKVGTMLAAGDCAGAAKFAYEKGRLELGSEIQRTCLGANRAPPLTATPATATIAQLLQQAAGRAVTPAPYDANTTVTRVAAVNNQLLLSATITNTSLFTDQWRSGVVRDLCNPDGFGALIRRGAVIRADFEDTRKIALGTLTVNSQSCS